MVATKNPYKRPQTGTARRKSLRPHASRGGTRGYDMEMRIAAVMVKDSNAENLPIYVNL